MRGQAAGDEGMGTKAGRPGKVPGPPEPILVRHLQRLRAPRARRRGSRVGTSLSSQRFSLLPEPTWAEQRGGVRGSGRSGGCCAWGGGAGRAAPPGPLPPRSGQSSNLCATLAGTWGYADLLSG